MTQDERLLVNYNELMGFMGKRYKSVNQYL